MTLVCRDLNFQGTDFVCFFFFSSLLHCYSPSSVCRCSVIFCCCSVAQACPTLGPHGLQHTRLPCPSPSPGICSNSCPSSQGCHPTISSSVVPFSSCLQTFPASGSLPMSQVFALGGQSTGVSTSPSNVYSELISFRIDWFDILA